MASIRLVSPVDRTLIGVSVPYSIKIAGYLQDTDVANKTVEINFNGTKYTTTTNSQGYFEKTVTAREYGTYFVNIKIPPLAGYYFTFSLLKSREYGDFYWVGLRMYVNGALVEEDVYTPIFPNDRVKITGKLYKEGKPVVGKTINCHMVIADTPYYHSVTNSQGYFEFNLVAPDWREAYLCNEKGRFARINCLECLSQAGYPISWDFNCTYACEEKPKTQPKLDPDYTYLLVDNVKYMPTMQARAFSDQKLTAVARIHNTGESGNVKFVVYDDTHKKELISATINIAKDSKKIVQQVFTMKESASIRFITYGWTGSKWVEYDKTGSIYVKISKRAYPYLIKSDTYLQYGSIKVFSGEFATVDRGTTITAHAKVGNYGDDDKVRVEVRDASTNQVIASKQVSVLKGQIIEANVDFKMPDKNIDVIITVSYWDGSKWVVSDKSGC
mgnify:CR=1 FL=1